MRTAPDWEYAQTLQKKPDLDTYMKTLIDHLQVIQQAADINNKENQERNKKIYDRNSRPTPFKVGDTVFMLNRTKKPHENRKYYKKFVGPLIIVGQRGHNHFRLRWVSNERLLKNTICGDHLKLYRDSIYKPYLTREEQELRQTPLATSPRKTAQETTEHTQETTANDRQPTENRRTNRRINPQRQETAPPKLVPIKRVVRHVKNKYLVEFPDGTHEWKLPHEVSEAAKADFYNKPDRPRRHVRIIGNSEGRLL